VIIVNFPYNISNLRQQSGRAGRRKKDSLSILVGGSFPIDQHYMAHPDEIFLKPNVALSVDLENILTREGHIQCAAHEMPIEPVRDRAYFGNDLPTIAAERLIKDNGGFYHSHPNFNPYPSRHVAIRNCEESGYAIVDVTNNRNVVLEEIEPSRAIFILYEGGIFLHQGRSYLVRSFSQGESLARVEAVNVNWTTSCRDFTDVDPIETELVRHIPESKSKAFFGKIRITSVVFGFFKLDKHKRILDAVEVENRPLILSAKGFWIDIPRSALDIIRTHRMNAAAAVHAAEHAVMSLLPSFLVGATSGDELRTECKAPEKEFAQKETSRKRPARLIFYDRTNAGMSKKAFEFVFELLKRAVERVEGCRACVNGCPECCCGERCREGNAVVSKHGAAVVLRCILGWEIDESWLAEVAEEGERGWDGGKETVIPADEVGGRAIVEIKEEESSRFANCIL
jgi:DEAD/DEAH box helicase domain-containing protein